MGMRWFGFFLILLIQFLIENTSFGFFDKYFDETTEQGTQLNFWNNYYSRLRLGYSETELTQIAGKICEKDQNHFKAFVDCANPAGPRFKKPYSEIDKANPAALDRASKVDQASLNELALKEFYHAVYRVHCEGNPDKAWDANHVCLKTDVLNHLTNHFSLDEFKKVYNLRTQAQEFSAHFAEKHKTPPAQIEDEEELNRHAEFVMAFEHPDGCIPNRHPAIVALKNNLVKILNQKNLNLEIPVQQKRSIHHFYERALAPQKLAEVEQNIQALSAAVVDPRDPEKFKEDADEETKQAYAQALAERERLMKLIPQPKAPVAFRVNREDQNRPPQNRQRQNQNPNPTDTTDESDGEEEQVQRRGNPDEEDDEEPPPRPRQNPRRRPNRRTVPVATGGGKPDRDCADFTTLPSDETGFCCNAAHPKIPEVTCIGTWRTPTATNNTCGNRFAISKRWRIWTCNPWLQ